MANPPFQVKALYDYKSPHEDDLSFPGAQVITVTDEEDNDWYYGEYVDAGGKKQEGLFPKNFVKPYEPETPPRPTRSNRPKKEPEPPPATTQIELPDEEPEVVYNESRSQAGPSTGSKEPLESEDIEPESEPQSQLEPVALPSPPQVSAKAPQPVAPSASREPKPAPPIAAKGPPPAVTEKPASGSFRDRINAFNKSTAPPPAPSKPAGLGGSGGSSFIKKPFVAPPPSKNAYVPPPRQDAPHKIYRREEDPELMAKSAREQEDEGPTPTQAEPTQAGEAEDQPKPTSLKERIALLQKQQAEQASRHAEKKEKPKRPPKKQEMEETPPDHDDDEGEDLETSGKRSVDTSRDTRSGTKQRKSREEASGGSSAAVPPRDTFSDGNDADQSGAADTGEEEDQSTGRDDSDEKPQRQASIVHQQPPQSTTKEFKTEEAEEEAEGEEDEEDDVDPEVKRRMEIRERMAKMSGGMGMAGMFGPPGGMPQPRAPTKQGTGSSERKLSSNSRHESASEASRAPPVPIMPMPGMAKVRSQETEANLQNEPEVEKEDADPQPPSSIHTREPEDMPDVEDLAEEPVPSRKSTERSAPPPPPSHAREVPQPPGQSRGAPPPVPSERPAPPPPASSRPLPPPPAQPLSPSEGSISDDEMPSQPTEAGIDEAVTGNDSHPATRGPPPPPPSGGPPPPTPSRPSAPQSRLSGYGNEGLAISSPTSPSEKRSSRVPPIPGAVAAPQSRAPPPPPPSAAPSAPVPPSRSATLHAPNANSRGAEVSDEEVTEYDGDYDTDMASGATHKDALSAHGQIPSGDDESESMTENEVAMHHAGLPSMGPPVTAPRAVPPPPPAANTQPTRQSSDIPRAAPPPPPRRNESYDNQNDDYDPYNYTASPPIRSATSKIQSSTTPTVEEPNELFAASPSQRSVPTPQQPPDQYPASPNIALPSRPVRGQSSDIQRTSTSIRRSTDAPRHSGEHGFMAADVDLAEGSRWWTTPNAPPPIFQNRRDILFETEDVIIAKRGGKQAVTRTVYVLYMDYSQTTITAQFESHNSASASLEQSHEPPPRSLRQDQLENAHSRFGDQIAKAAESKKDSIVHDGTPHALPLDLISSIPDALLPVGIRAYGALVYANLANASVQQYDEIRPGDIVTFRNAKFQGHRGTMHSKYSIDVGKPDHVAVVIDWDGTKKKIRAWEQGRESRKVKPESFKFGDMKSGEAKVWRVMARSWVGWEGQN